MMRICDQGLHFLVAKNAAPLHRPTFNRKDKKQIRQQPMHVQIDLRRTNVDVVIKKEKENKFRQQKFSMDPNGWGEASAVGCGAATGCHKRSSRCSIITNNDTETMAREKNTLLSQQIKRERAAGLKRYVAWMAPQPKRLDGRPHEVMPDKQRNGENKEQN
jgi:hypothetical protein